ncbi:MAG: Kelch repeat-containing protein, partial [Blastocatellia bacterium]
EMTVNAPWKLVAHMPASNHDLTAAVLGNRFYISGGLTAEWGFPARSRAFDELWALDGRDWQWRVAANLGHQRIYTATAAFDHKVWIIGGDIMHADGQRPATAMTQLYDPRTNKITRGPDNTIARPMPMALVANGRLYVVGNVRGEYDNPGKMESIGPGETSWRAEPDGPAGMGPLAGAALDGRLYILVPKKGLAVFDTKTNRWDLIAHELKPRSCQMAAWRGEIWMMGGRDIPDMKATLIYNPKTRAFRTGPSLPIAISWGAAEVLNGRLIVTGGAASRRQGERQYVYSHSTFSLQKLTGK